MKKNDIKELNSKYIDKFELIENIKKLFIIINDDINTTDLGNKLNDACELSGYNYLNGFNNYLINLKEIIKNENINIDKETLENIKGEINKLDDQTIFNYFVKIRELISNCSYNYETKNKIYNKIIKTILTEIIRLLEDIKVNRNEILNYINNLITLLANQEHISKEKKLVIA